MGSQFDLLECANDLTRWMERHGHPPSDYLPEWSYPVLIASHAHGWILVDLDEAREMAQRLELAAAKEPANG